MGKVNNAITAQILASKYKVSSIVSIGLAGALNDTLKQGDIIVSTDSVQHDTGTIKPYGFIWSKTTKVGVKIQDELFYKWSAISGYPFGQLVSGDQFISDKNKRGWLAKKFDALAVDTNSAAIKEVCDQNRISCGFIRGISDNASVNARESFDFLARSKDIITVNALKRFLDYVTR